MALTSLTSNLEKITKAFGSDTKTGNIKDKAGKLSRDLVTAVLPRTNFLDKSGNVKIDYNEKDTYRVKLSDIENSPIKLHWESEVPTPGGVGKNYYDRGQSTTDALGIRKNKFPSDQPFIIREIGERWDGSDFQRVGNTGDWVRGGIPTKLGRTGADFIRIGKFLKSSAGWNFTGKQSVFQLLNVGGDLGERANIYNPLSPLLSTLPYHPPRHVDIPYASDFIRKSLVGNLPGKLGGSDKESARYKKTSFNILSLLGISTKPKLSDIENTGVVRGIDDKSWGDRVNLVPYGQKTQADITAAEKDDFIPFRFKDVNNNKYIIFRALLSGIADNITPEYSSTRYVGRPDQVHVYQGTNREISFTFDVYPKTEQELPVLWEKLNYLVGLVYPSWAPSSSGFGMIAPFIELTIGDMYKDTPGFLSQLSLTVQDGTTWEIKDWKLPKYIQASCSFTYVGKYLPNQIGKHYELDWLTNSNTPLGTFTKATDHYPRRSETKPALGTKRDRLVKLFGNLGQVWDKETPFIS